MAKIKKPKAKGKKPAAEPIRLYYLPETVDFQALPEAIKLVLQEIVQPAYDELVLGAPTALERSTGASFTFLLTEEVLDEFELGHQLNLTGAPRSADAAERHQLIARHLRVVSAKQNVARFLLRLQELRMKTELALAAAGHDQGMLDSGK